MSRLPAISVNFHTGENFTTVSAIPGETIRVQVDGRPYDLVYHEEPYHGTFGAKYPSISLRRV